MTEQIESATRFFASLPHVWHDFLLKPSADALFISRQSLAEAAANAEGFQLIGITEKELGSSIIDRLVAIATLRRALDAAGARSAIHVFGSLDPLLSPLYWLAGAEVFDGLSWLTMGWDEANLAAVYPDSASVALGSWTQHEMRRRADRWSNNLRVAERVMMLMREFTVENDFNVFGVHAARIAEGMALLRTRLERPA
jgi:hypothetical protein